MKVGIKYCGGCNSSYNRKAFVEKLMEKHEDIKFEVAKEDFYYDIILIMNGCIRACAYYEKLSGKIKLFVNSQDDFYKVDEVITNYKK